MDVTKFPKTCARADGIPVEPGRDLTEEEAKADIAFLEQQPSLV